MPKVYEAFRRFPSGVCPPTSDTEDLLDVGLSYIGSCKCTLEFRAVVRLSDEVEINVSL